MKEEEPNIKPSLDAGEESPFQAQPKQQQQRQPRTISTTSYDSDSDDNMQQGASTGPRKDSDGEPLDASGSNSASKYDYEDSKAACKILNGREARNRAEKNRRDKLNGSIQELSGMVPHVAESPRRVDKTAVLRFSAHALRVDYVFSKPETEQPTHVVQPEVQDTLFRMLNGFLLTVTCRGQIVLASASVEQFLGHCQTDLYGQNLFNMVHPDDHNTLKQQLVPSNIVNLFESSSAPSTSTARTATPAPGDGCEEQQRRSQEEEEEIDRKLRQDRRKFTLRIARAGPRSEPTAYELVTIDGCFRRANAAPRGAKTSGPSGLQLLRRARGRDDGISLHSINGNDIVLVAMARVQKVPTICDRLIEACKYEYKTRHLIDGRIVQCDHRISVVAGYLTNEVSGLSPFTFMHKDDVRWVIVALRQMYDYNQKDGESCYRLMTRTGDFVYLKTRGYLEVDSSTKVVQSFVCINTLVSDEEGRRLVKEMKRKFSVIVDQEELPDESDEPGVENQQQIERAVMNLITNLHPEEDEPNDSAMQSGSTARTSDTSGNTQLAIIAPKPSQVKSAIFKSMNVIAIASKKISESGNNSPSRDGTQAKAKDQMESGNITSATQRPSVLQKVQNQSPAHESRVPPLPSSEHYFTQPFSPASTTSSSGGSVLSPASQHQRNSRSPFGGSIPPSSPPAISAAPSASYSRTANFDSTSSRTSSVLKRTYSNSSICSNDGSMSTVEYLELKRCKASPPDLSACLSELTNPASDLTIMLPGAFDAVDQSLRTMENTTAIMRERVSSFEDMEHSQLRLHRIVEEQQEQREILQSIQQEYTFQIQSNGGGGGGGAANGNGHRRPEELDDELLEGAALVRGANIVELGGNANNGNEFFSSVRSPMVSPTTATTASVITTSRSMSGATSGTFYRGTDFHPS